MISDYVAYLGIEIKFFQLGTGSLNLRDLQITSALLDRDRRIYICLV